jgi:type IV pilus assembly protein PilN
LVFLWYQAQISEQQDKNQFLKTEIKKPRRPDQGYCQPRAEIAALRARQQAVEDLQSDRNMPVHLLTELVGQLPDGVYITNMRQDGQTVTIQGVAQSNERVSELLRNLVRHAVVGRPELIEIVAGTVNQSARDQRRVANFTISGQLCVPAMLKRQKTQLRRPVLRPNRWPPLCSHLAPSRDVTGTMASLTSM